MISKELRNIFAQAVNYAKKSRHEYLGRVISYNDMIFMISNIATTMFIGIAAAFLSLELITAIIGTGFFVFAIYFNWIKKFL